MGSTDRAIIALRRLIVEAIRTVQVGDNPRAVDPESYRHVRAVDHLAESEAEIPAVIAREIAARF